MLCVCIYHVMGHNEEMLLFHVQDEVQAYGCILLNRDDRVLLHLPIWPQEHLWKYINMVKNKYALMI